MSKLIHNTFLGLSIEADIAFLYLLQSCKKNSFQNIIIEGDNWEDFTLVFDDHVEDFEVKWHSVSANSRSIRKIVEKEMVKNYAEKDAFRIVVKSVDKSFKEDYEYARHSLPWWHHVTQKNLIKNKIFKRFINNGWSDRTIAFLLRTDVVELESIDNINAKIHEFFAIEFPFYLTETDEKSIVAITFKVIFEKGSKGASISKKDFQTFLNEFKLAITKKSESFSPEISIGKQIVNLSKFLVSEQEFAKLNHEKYLSPISDAPRLIFYIANYLEKCDFSTVAMDYFFRKILIKESYIRLAFRILEKKWSRSKLDTEYFLDFVIQNYKYFTYDFDYDDALRILKDIALKDIKGVYDEKIIGFLKKDVLRPFIKQGRRRSSRIERRGWREDDLLAEMLQTFLHRVVNKDAFINFMFEYFDFTSDDFENVVETHPLIYIFVKDYIKSNWTRNFSTVVNKISQQFNAQYNNKYKGYEWTGSGIGGWGTEYSITDKGMVRFLFQPLFLEFYNETPNKAWTSFKSSILNKAKLGATKECPVYLKRALIPVLISRLASQDLTVNEKAKTYKYLENILSIKKGIPGTSDIIFSHLSAQNLEEIGFDRIMELINIDSIKYKRKGFEGGYPTNLFVIATLINLIKFQYSPAKEFFLSLFKKPDFVKYDHQYNTFELLVREKIPETDPSFIVDIIESFDFEAYLNSFDNDIVWDKSGIIFGLIKKDWEQNTTIGQRIFTSFLKNKIPGKKVLEFLAGPIRDLSRIDCKKMYELMSPYLDKSIFAKTFKNNDNFRENIVAMGEDLVKNKYYNEAKYIVELCIDDPDPNTDEESKYNYHLKIKNGEKENGISSVRGKTAWVLQQFALTNDKALMAYAFEKTKILLDLDGLLARKLGYKESDLYVRKQALVPYMELAHAWRRKQLNEYQLGLGDEVKKVAFQLVSQTNKQFETGLTKPTVIVEYIQYIFSYIRDLNVEEAKAVLNFFTTQEETDAQFLWVYFAEFIEDKSFDTSYFKEKLEEMCSKDNPFRESFSSLFWRVADDDSKKKKQDFLKIEKYWKLLTIEYNNNIFQNIYRTLDITLKWPSKYAEHKEILKKILTEEMTFYIKNKQSIDLWHPGHETFNIFFERSQDDYLEMLLFLIINIEKANKEGVHISFTFMRNWLNLLRSVDNLKTEIKDRINAFIEEIYPEYAEYKR